MIQKIIEKVKGLLKRDEVFIMFVSVLVSVLIFGALQLLLKGDGVYPISIEENAFSIKIPHIEEQGSDMFYIVSKNGTKYYPKFCNAANRIKEENRLYFASVAEAEKAGYELSKLCK